MRIKKILSVFLVAVMLFSVVSVGVVGAAAEIDYAAQYRALALALQNEHVRELTNYTVTNATLEENDGFDQEARGFAYDHSVVAKDNAAGDILKASNRFYYIAESLMSYKYGVGCYDASTLVSYITEKIKPYFASTSGEVIYEDFYGDRYYPSAEEIEAYNNAVSNITAVGGEVNQATLTEFGIYFMEMDDWAYYNVEAILKYFVGNVLKINTGNWYHRFSFVVQTSVDSILENCIGIESIGNPVLTIRTAVYQISYQKEYNESMSKAYFAFEEPSIERVCENYASKYNFESNVSADLTKPVDGFPGLLREGQASAYMIQVTYDEETVPYLQNVASQFDSVVATAYNSSIGMKWDAYFVYLSDKAIKNSSDLAAIKAEFIADYKKRLDDPTQEGALNAYANKMAETVTGSYINGILGYAGDLANNYSNAALKAVFGNRLGNMVTLAYLFKTSKPNFGTVDGYVVKDGNGNVTTTAIEGAMADTANPSRIVRDNAPYIASADKLDDIIHDLDALVSPGENENADYKISNRVATVVSMFLDVGSLLGIEGDIDYTTLEDLIGKVLQQLVFSDAIVNMLVEMLYPMITNLLTDLLGNLTGVGFLDGMISDLLDDVIKDNDLAIYPNDLGSRIEKDYPGEYNIATTILKNAPGNSWENVSFEAMTWGVDEAPIDEKSEYFLRALCAGLGGFTRLLVTFLCGDLEYETKAMQSIGNFGRYYDLKIIPGLSAWLVSQGLYTKLFIPLYRVLGLKYEAGDYLSSKDFHAGVVSDIHSCLREAVRPILTWVTKYVAKQPFETIMTLVPNLVHFLSRTSTVNLDYADEWESPSFATNQEGCHEGFAQLQTHSLWSIMENVHVSIQGIMGFKIWSGSIASFLSKQSGMLSSLNALLNEVLSLKYESDEATGEKKIVCYSDYNGNIVLADSQEYALNPSAYPNAHMKYWSDASNTSFSLEKDEAHPFFHEHQVYYSYPYYLPAIPEAKLISCGEVYEPTTHNTIKVEHPGLVFKFLLRYVLSALGYRYTLETVPVLDENGDETGFMKAKVPSLIECFGLDTDTELFMGLKLSDILDNVMLHPDEALCALLELFYSNEQGDLYYKGKDSFTYPVTPIDYHEDVLLDKSKNPTLTYGAEVKYSKYWTKEYARDFVSNLGPLVEDVLVMLGIEGMEDGLGPFLENLLNESVFTNDLINTLFNMIYQLLSGLNESVGIDIEGILSAVLDVNFTPITVARAVDRMMGFESPATRAIREAGSWQTLFDGGASYDPFTGEYTPIIRDVDLDWGLKVDEETNTTLAEANGLSRADAFLRTVSALLSPAAFILKFLFMDYDLSILGLINLPGYPGYQYAFIGLLEALSCPGILPYSQYFAESLDEECGDANVIYNLFSPLLGLLEKVYESPVDTLLNLLPNLLFFISVGGLSDFVNNLVHFAYVLLDILKPIINGYDLLSGLLANIEISGLSLNLTLPLDIDVNSLISDLLGTLVGDALTIEGVSIQLPYIDLYTICVGTLEEFTSKEGRQIVHLNPAGGGELLTALLRIVFEVLFMEENHHALTQIVSNLAGEGKLDAYDEETLYMVINGLIGLIEEYEVLDMVLYAVYMLITKLVPIADTLAPRFQANNMTITDLIDSASDMDLFMANIQLLMKDPTETEVPDTTTDIQAIGSLFDRIKAFFEKIKLFFQQLFNFG